MGDKSDMHFEKALFDATVGIEGSSGRLEFLTKACAGDTAMLSLITGWLDAQDAAEKFFREATVARAEEVNTVLEALADDPATSSEWPDASDEVGPGSRFGRYQILERMGEGGHGVVFMAEQSEPVRRKVALKVIRRGLDTERVIARFETERQSIAMMDHPNIAKIYDAGSSDAGRPYFVMELVTGEKITEHCDAMRMGIRQRLELFIHVCNAIQHAHQKGIIHRDIKPSNILVATQDGQATPKVIDFGIARAVEVRLSDETQFTGDSQMIGTPAYMSPEQAEGCLNLDTRGDIYSLGILLYELLTGRPPFDSKRLAQAGMLEMMRILREEDPLAPSAMLQHLESSDLKLVASHRNIGEKPLVSMVRGDLDEIVLKSLEKNCQSRYATVAGLMADVRRFLNDEPISARPRGQFYQFAKLVRRNKLAFSAALAIVLALAAGGVASNWFYLREHEAHEAAEAARANETRLLQQARARESISQATILLSRGNVGKAEEILANTPLASIEQSTDAFTAFRWLGDWCAIRQSWKKSAECYALFIKVNGFERVPESEVKWIMMAAAVALAEARDHSAYEAFRNQMVLKYGHSADYIFGAIILKSCLLAPTKAPVLQQLQSIANQVGNEIATDPPDDGDVYQRAFAAMSMALMDYRRENFSQSLKWSQKCLESKDFNTARNATALAIKSMAARKLGQIDLANSALEHTRGFFVAPFEWDTTCPRGQGQGYWQDWAIARTLLREAENQAASEAHKNP